MAGVYRLEIQESAADLKKLLRAQTTASNRERIHMLYLLKSEQASTIQQASALLGRNRVTVQKWARQYREGGLAALLSHKPRKGRPRSIPDWAQAALKQRLEQEDGFTSYSEIVQWLKEHLGVEAPYKTVHQLVHYHLKASSKVVRSKSNQQDE